MIRLQSQEQLERQPDTPLKRAALDALEAVGRLEGRAYDVIAECGEFLLLEPHDDLSRLQLGAGGAVLNLLELEGACVDHVQSHAEGIYLLYVVLGDRGGPAVIIPSAPWVPSAVLERLSVMVCAA